MFDYPVTLTQDGDTVLVTFADVPQAITFGAASKCGWRRPEAQPFSPAT